MNAMVAGKGDNSCKLQIQQPDKENISPEDTNQPKKPGKGDNSRNLQIQQPDKENFSPKTQTSPRNPGRKKPSVPTANKQGQALARQEVGQCHRLTGTGEMNSRRKVSH
jgi:hypothetical protein